MGGGGRGAGVDGLLPPLQTNLGFNTERVSAVAAIIRFHIMGDRRGETWIFAHQYCHSFLPVVELDPRTLASCKKKKDQKI